MNPSFSSYLINDVFGDPGIYVEIRWSRRALLFDLGRNEALGPTRLLRANDIFVSHTHMDHFIGFDAVLRVALGRGKTLRLYGPSGLIDNVEGKLRGYTWNLVNGYPLVIEVQEFLAGEARKAVFHAAKGFVRSEQPTRSLTSSETGVFTVLEDPMFTDVWEGKPDDFRFIATLYDEHRRSEHEFVLGDLKERFLTISRGQKIVYVVDARYDDDNEAKIVSLAEGADVLYCESPYLDVDAGKARDRYHLTARQAGHMARLAGVRDLVVFHFSPRYTGQGEALEREALEVFHGA
jgi:ribonuclease Z